MAEGIRALISDVNLDNAFFHVFAEGFELGRLAQIKNDIAELDAERFDRAAMREGIVPLESDEGHRR